MHSALSLLQWSLHVCLSANIGSFSNFTIHLCSLHNSQKQWCWMLFSFHSSATTKNFQPIENTTFISNKTSKIITISTRKSYSRLRIFARIPSSSSQRQNRFTIHSINMFYYYCEEKTAYNTTLKRVNSSTTDINKTVQCQSNAVSSNDGNSTIIVKCTPQGVRDLDSETCVCLKGFEGFAKCLSK